MAVPTEAEWGEYQADLDQKYAHDLFAGRTNQEMLPHFRRNVIERTDELRWMPEVPFQYYVLGFRDFVMAGEFDALEASDAANCFLGLALEKLEKQPRFIVPVMSQLLPAIRYVAANQATYYASESICGSFPEKLKRIESLYENFGHTWRVRSRRRKLAITLDRRLLTSADREVTIPGMRELLRRVFLVDLFQGMWVTFRYQAPKNIYTEQYPQERPMVAERYRGAPRLNMNPETGESLCISCNLCALACPENLIVVGWLRDDATRRKVLTTFTYDTSRCMFCGLCEDACPTDCLELTQDFEMASYSREGAIWDRHRLEAGPTPTHYTR